MDAMKLSLDLIELPYEIGGIKYVLREATQNAVRMFDNSRSAAGRFSDGKLSRVSGLADSEGVLVANCLFPIVGDPQTGGEKTSPAHMPIDVILGWPSRVVKPLLEKIKEISDIDQAQTKAELEKQLADTQEQLDLLAKDEEDSAKNVPDDTPITSDSPPSTE